MRTLNKYEDYNREEVHDIFSPHTHYTPQAGTWGLQGIVKISDTKDYIFYVTIGSQQGEHVFEEGITEDGILTWQSQPRQNLNSKTIASFINHNHDLNNIYLFFRTQRTTDYTYLGKLAYVSHDPERECPVYFKWQILDWEITTDIANRIGSVFQNVKATSAGSEAPIEALTKHEPPVLGGRTRVESTREFKARKVDFADTELENKKLGSNGEKLVIDYEKRILTDHGRADLAEKVVHVAETIGDGAGYDVESYDLSGNKKYIEVKTTCGGERTPFILTINELEFSRTHAENYSLYRVYDFNKKTQTGSFFIINGCVRDNFSLESIRFKCYR